MDEFPKMKVVTDDKGYILSIEVDEDPSADELMQSAFKKAGATRLKDI